MNPMRAGRCPYRTAPDRLQHEFPFSAIECVVSRMTACATSQIGTVLNAFV